MWPFRRKQTTAAPQSETGLLSLPPQSPDTPRGFGFKTAWWALPCSDTAAVAAAIGLQDAQPANWQTGVKYAYDRRVFVTPPVDGWTLITGFRLHRGGDSPREEVIDPLLELSSKFGAALVFASHRVVDYHLWAKAVGGSLVRGYAYLGESGKTLWDEGPMTPEERALGFAFFDERSPEAESESYWERGDLDFPTEMNVMDVARAWSVSPHDLDGYKPTEQLLGILGSRAELLESRFDQNVR